MDIKNEHSQSSASMIHCRDRLYEIVHECQQRSAQHVKQALATRNKHNRITIPSIVIAAVGSAIAYVPVGTDVHTQGTDITPILIAVISTINTILVGIINFYKWDQQSSSHGQAAKHYTLLQGSIQDYVIRMSSDSEEAQLERLAKVRKEFVEILQSSPLIQIQANCLGTSLDNQS